MPTFLPRYFCSLRHFLGIRGLCFALLVSGIGASWLLATVWASSLQAATIFYVNDNANGANDGTSWPDAFTDLQSALNVATSGDQIWVASGVYVPGTVVSDTFTLMNGVELYGGFSGAPGTEGDFSARDWLANVTVVSGDLAGDDTTDANGIVTDTARIVRDNAYHVVVGSGTDSTAILDGFTITAGFATGAAPGAPDAATGGGMYNFEGSPTLRNLHFIGNRAVGAGGGLYNEESSPTLDHVTFSNNLGNSGGGLYNSHSNPALTEVTFVGNQAANSGGGMNNSFSSPTLSDVTFSGNRAGASGGGMENGSFSHPNLTGGSFIGNLAVVGGGMAAQSGSNPSLYQVTFIGNSASNGGGISSHFSSPLLINVVFIGNRADRGSGIYYSASSGGIPPTLTNVTFSGNLTSSGGTIHNVGSDPHIQNTILWGNSASPHPSVLNTSGATPTLRYSLVEGGLPAGSTDGDSNLFVDPLFIQAPSCGGDNICADDPTTPDDESADDDYGDLRLQPASPAIDTGDNTADLDASGPMTTTIGNISTDLAGTPRIVAVRLITPTVDLGAYEMPNSPPAFVSTPILTATEGLAYTYIISTTDSNQPDGSGLLITAITLPSWLTLSTQGNGTGTLNGTPTAAEAGIHAVTLQVQDNDGLTDTQSFSLTVIAAIAATGSISGVVENEQGQGIAGVVVTIDEAAQGQTAAAPLPQQTTTDASGAYGFTELLPGLYTLSFAPPAGLIQPPPMTVEVQAGQTAMVPATELVAVQATIALTATVGTQAGVCAATDTVGVEENTPVYYCYTVRNTSDVTFTMHNLVDSHLGDLFDPDLSHVLEPGATISTVQLGVTISATLATTTTSTATWTATVEDGPSATASDSVTVRVPVPLDDPTGDPVSKHMLLPWIDRAPNEGLAE